MKNNIKYLGIDIGGAHFKIIGLDKKSLFVFQNTENVMFGKVSKNLKKEIDYINSLNLSKNIYCGITMTAELCDNFKSKKIGAVEISKLCKKLKFNCSFYTKKRKIFKIY